jgi:hypothetical protein
MMSTAMRKLVLSTTSTMRFHSFIILLFCVPGRLHHLEILFINHNSSAVWMYVDRWFGLGFFSA